MRTAIQIGLYFANSAARVRKDLRQRMDDWRNLLVRQTSHARRIVTKLIQDRLVGTAHPYEQLCQFRGTATLKHLIAGPLPSLLPGCPRYSCRSATIGSMREARPA